MLNNIIVVMKLVTPIVYFVIILLTICSREAKLTPDPAHPSSITSRNDYVCL